MLHKPNSKYSRMLAEMIRWREHGMLSQPVKWWAVEYDTTTWYCYQIAEGNMLHKFFRRPVKNK